MPYQPSDESRGAAFSMRAGFPREAEQQIAPGGESGAGTLERCVEQLRRLKVLGRRGSLLTMCRA